MKNIKGCLFTFITGRLCFGDTKTNAPFPSVLVKLTGSTSEMLLVDKDDLLNI